jgi:tetratricopeptide (TPR) repeat protein
MIRRLILGRWMKVCVTASILSVLSVAANSAMASGSTEYDAGLKAYTAHNYKLAAQSFQKSVAAGNNTALVLLYIGHAYLGEGDKAHALESYRKLADKFPTSGEAQIAISCLLRLDPSLSSKYHLAPVATATASTVVSVATAAGSDPKKATLIDRIVVFPPAAGHPAVSHATLSTVRDLVRKLPRHMYQYLSDGGATINLVPNIEDKWPGFQ